MSAASGPSDDDLATLDRLATALADGIDAAIAPWVERTVFDVLRSRGEPMTEAIIERARAAGVAAASTVGPRVRALLALDIDEQRTGPLAIVREVVPFPTSVLVDAGIPPADRDAHAVALFPEDRYDLAPASFADLDPALAEVGIAWGAAKAHIHLARRRAND